MFGLHTLYLQGKVHTHAIQGVEHLFWPVCACEHALQIYKEDRDTIILGKGYYRILTIGHSDLGHQFSMYNTYKRN